MTSNQACDYDRLPRLLAGELADDPERETTEHLEACAACRARLESLAGQDEWWAEVETCLRRHTERLTPGMSSANTGASGLEGPPGTSPPESFTADFAVDFLEPCDRPETIGRLEDIEILEVIGRGGMGIVLKGYQRELGRYVAVKVMAPHFASSGTARQRFAREARAAAAIVHPHVMAIHSVNATSRLPHLVMPYVACESLQQRIDRDGPLELKQILRIGHQIASGLAAAHAQGLVHRDVKPANILLERGVDRVMLTDFGLARAADDATLTRTGVIAGTPQYMSPEQARGEPVDARSDLFSLGSVIYTMGTGRPPFRAETSYGILRRITDSEPREMRELVADTPQWLGAIVQTLHAKPPESRFQSATELAELFEQCLAHVQQPTVVSLPSSVANMTATGARQPGRFRLWTPWIVAGAVAGVALTAGIVALTRHHPLEAVPQTTTESTSAQRPAGNANPPAIEPLTQWDATADALDVLSRDAVPLESRAGRPWDYEAPPIDDKSSTSTAIEPEGK